MLSQRLIDYFKCLETPKRLPRGIQALFPFQDDTVESILKSFYEKYYSDENPRVLVLGINPGRLGAGITGISFTDPYHLEIECGISNPFDKKKELSSIFIYELIHSLGGVESFYSRFLISSVCPIGFIKKGINYNYYDDPALMRRLESYIVQSLKKHIALAKRSDVVFCLGKGKNFKYLNLLNQKYHFFDQIIPIPHPRWVLQYQRKNKDQIVRQIVEIFESL